VSPWKVTRFLLSLIGLLVFASTLGQLLARHYKDPYLKGFVPLFYLDGEGNIPAWYSACALLAAACLLGLIALHSRARKDPQAFYWGALTASFSLLSLDEVAQIHEYPIAPLREALHATGYLYYTWVVPAGLVLVAAAPLLWRFLLHLPRRTRTLFFAAAVVFVGGALGVEMISANRAYRYGEEDFAYTLIISVEELLEMVGVVLFIHALLDYIRNHFTRIQWDFAHAEEVPSATILSKDETVTRNALLALRNRFCALIAVFLIITGHVQRATKKVLGSDVITPIYFHKPSRKLFAQCISWLIRHGYTFISAEELVDILHKRRPFPRRAVWISLDDGYREWLAEVLPVIRQYKVPVTLFIPSGIIGGTHLFPWLHDPAYPTGKTDTARYISRANVPRESLTVGELKRIAAYSEVHIGGHTVNHALTTYATQKDLRFEIGECKRSLESWTNKPVSCFAYPAGCADGRERQFLQEFGFAVAATIEPDFIRQDQDPLLVPRFCVPDGVSFPEAICNMVGIWRTVLDPIKALFRVKGSFSAMRSSAITSIIR
jgi:peptidoglycan/xylan/chitin deacetylase (PgdA/CDA1 family)